MGLVLLALGQLATVHLLGLTRWRGGGMGMYSEPHPNLTVVSIVVDGRREVVEAWRCERLPSPACLRETLSAYPHAEAVEVRRPSFELSSRTLRHVRVGHVER